MSNLTSDILEGVAVSTLIGFAVLKRGQEELSCLPEALRLVVDAAIRAESADDVLTFCHCVLLMEQHMPHWKTTPWGQAMICSLTTRPWCYQWFDAHIQHRQYLASEPQNLREWNDKQQCVT